MSLNWWDKSCFKCSETSQWEKKTHSIELPWPSEEKNLCYKWLTPEIARYLSRPFAPFLCAEGDKIESRSDREINFCQQFPEVRLLNKCGHGISYSLFKEIETEFALKVINEQTLSCVLNADEFDPPNNPPVALMVVGCTFSGTGWIWSLPWSKTPRGMSEENLGDSGESPEHTPT